jgi:hypothetical protein
MPLLKCTYCNRDTDQGGGTTWDHVVPRCKGGSNTRDNKVICCKQCNEMKAALSLHKFKTVVSAFLRMKAIPEGYHKGDITHIYNTIKKMLSHAKV